MKGKNLVKPEISIVKAEEETGEDDSQIYFEIEELEDEDLAQEVQTTSVTYYCGSCDLNFDSLDDHVRRFHKNESIRVETHIADSPEETSIAVSEQEHDKIELEETQAIIEKPKNSENQTSDSNKFEVPAPKKWRKVIINSSNTPSTSNTNIITSIPRENLSRKASKRFKEEEDAADIDTDEETGSEYAVEIEDGESIIRVQEVSDEEEQLFEEEDIYLKTEAGAFLCGICKTEFSTNKQLRLHTRIHFLAAKATKHKKDTRNLLEEDWSLNCKLCNKIFVTKTTFDMHMEAHNSNNTIVQAPKGSMVLTDRSKPIYPCQYCGKEFIRPHEKVKHERVHTGEKPYACSTCGKCFRVSYCLTLHKRTHSDDRPYICPHCSKRFKAHSVYNHHLMTHSDAKNYKCPYCPKAFKTSVQLSGHKNSHTKPFACSTCSRKFATLYAVRGHMETHKNKDSNLKFSCAICGASYCREFALKDHVKANHPDAVYMIAQEEDDPKTSFIPDESQQSIYSTNDTEENYEVVIINEDEQEDLMEAEDYCMDA